MPSWNEVLDEIQNCPRIDALDFVRRNYLANLHKITGRNVIAYYSGWLQKPAIAPASINDDDKNGFMNAIFGMDRTKGLDLILHTPGGDIAATESLVDYLHKMFGKNIRAFVPQLAMSAGTMIACASKEIVMGKQSSIGPIDPQFGGVSTYAVTEEFKRALDEIKKDPSRIPIWQVIISKYHPTFIGECERAQKWASKIVSNWLQNGMLANEANAAELAQNIVRKLSEYNDTVNHARHIDAVEAGKLGLKISQLENDHNLQDCVLTIHHAYMHTFSSSPAYKIVENHDGKAIVFSMQQPLPLPVNMAQPAPVK